MQYQKEQSAASSDKAKNEKSKKNHFSEHVKKSRHHIFRLKRFLSFLGGGMCIIIIWFVCGCLLQQITHQKKTHRRQQQGLFLLKRDFKNKGSN